MLIPTQGNDSLNSESRDNRWQGGEGNDIYEFNFKFGNDEILNFKPNKNEIDNIRI